MPSYLYNNSIASSVLFNENKRDHNIVRCYDIGNSHRGHLVVAMRSERGGAAPRAQRARHAEHARQQRLQHTAASAPARSPLCCSPLCRSGALPARRRTGPARAAAARRAECAAPRRRRPPPPARTPSRTSAPARRAARTTPPSSPAHEHRCTPRTRSHSLAPWTAPRSPTSVISLRSSNGREMVVTSLQHAAFRMLRSPRMAG